MIKDYNNLDSFDYFQQEEIRKGLEKDIDVSVYAKPELPYNIMHQMRKGLESGHCTYFEKCGSFAKKMRHIICVPFFHNIMINLH